MSKRADSPWIDFDIAKPPHNARVICVLANYVTVVATYDANHECLFRGSKKLAAAMYWTLVPMPLPNGKDHTQPRTAALIDAAPDLLDASKIALDVIVEMANTLATDPDHDVGLLSRAEYARRTLVAAIAKGKPS